MRSLANLPIKARVTLVTMTVASAALLLAVTAFVGFDRVALRHTAVEKLDTLARVIAYDSATALIFQDRLAARSTLANLQAESEITVACLYDADGRPFARYISAGAGPAQPLTVVAADEARFINGELELTRRVEYEGKGVGTIYLRSNLHHVHERMARYAWIVLSVFVAACLLAWFLTARLQKLISNPIVQLVRTAQDVTARGDYSVRAEAHSEDEAGRLIRAFNSMLAGIQERDTKLQEAKTDLERRVLERTAALEEELRERRRAENDLQQLVTLYVATLDSTNDGILVVNNQGRIVSFNRKFTQMWRVPLDVMSSKDDSKVLQSVLDQLVAPDDFLAKVQERYANKEAESVDVIEFQDGRVFERYSQPHRVGEEVVGRVWSFHDVTAHRQAEQALRQSEEKFRQAQKMDAIGRLAGGVAHDFNNVLTVINGYSDLLVRRAAPDDPQRRFLEEINEAGTRAAALTRQLLAFSRKQVLQPRVLDLNTIVTGMEQMLRRLIGENIELETELGPKLAAIQADPGQLEQVILNFAVNARDAMPDGGRLVLRTANVIVNHDNGESHSPVPPGAYVVLSVIDSGMGMTPEVQAHLFEPFFTTKGMGKGTGLGLATCYGIVKQSGGEIRLVSRPNHGTAIMVYLPQVQLELTTTTSSQVSGLLPSGAETVLLVEDEPALRELATCVLRDCGYTVFEAANGREALDLLAMPNAPHLDLLVTDVIMPQMGGKELATRMKVMRPGCRVLFISGYTDDALVHYGVGGNGFAFLEKPFTPSALAQKVRTVLDQPVTV